MKRHALEGLRVADLGWLWQGPYIAKYLADHGAEVVHIESATRPDICRLTAPFKDGIPGINRSGFFAQAHSNKYGVSLNLNHLEGIKVAKRLVVWADVVIENYSPETMKRWGMDYDSLKKIKPDVIMVHGSVQGMTGPHAAVPGFATVNQALMGLTYLAGWPDREPIGADTAPTDFIVPAFGTVAVLAALDYRRRTGKGQFIELSQFETICHFLAPVFLDYGVNGRVQKRMGNRCPYGAPHGVYPCRGNNRWCAIAVFTDEEWQAFCQAVGEPPWTEEQRFATLLGRKENEEDLDRLVGEWTINFTAEQAMAILQSAGVGAGVVLTNEDLHNDPQLKYRHHYWKLKHSEMGTCAYSNEPVRLSKTPAELRMPAPCLGEHNEYVYTKILGMSDEEFLTLLAAGAFE